jgi:DNA-directed RNA polymerase subunit A'
MNLHVPQSEEARAEAEALMLVEKHILSPRFGGPIIGAIHDFISGAYLLTSSYFTKDEATLILRSGGIKDELWEPDKIENGVPLYSGKKIFSKALPKGLNLRYKAKICRKCDECKKEDCPYDAYVVIKDGELIKGVIDKNGYGAEAGLILHTIVKEFGPEAGRKFLDSATKMAIRAVMLRGFTTGIDDEDLPEEALKEIEEILDEAEEKVKEIIEKYERGELELLPGLNLEESREAYISNVLREARDKAGAVAERYLGLDNHAVIMAVTGARGNILNITQMAACLGQQSVRGKRIFRGYRGRVLPHFEKGSLDARSHGFVRSSYKKGLSPTEFFFHAMGGREGLVDQAVRTAQSGYMQRRLINALQDLKTEYDGTVRDSRGIIVQFMYGEDGVDPMLADRGKAVNIDRIIDKVKMKYNK